MSELEKGGCMVTNFDLLKKTIEDSGMTITAISKKTGIVRETLYNRFDGKSEFKASEIVALADVLGLSKPLRDKIFLNKKLN